MLGEGPQVGYIPTPIIELHGGSLYNLVVCLLVALGCSLAGWLILKCKGNKPFAFFLFAVGVQWLAVTAGNIFASTNMLSFLPSIAYLVKGLSVIPLIVLAYFILSETVQSRIARNGLTLVYVIAAALYLPIAFFTDGTQSLVNYWGVQWPAGGYSLQYYRIVLLVPIGALAGYQLFSCILNRYLFKKQKDLFLALSVIAYLLLENVQVSVSEMSWQVLLMRLLYLLIAFTAYLYFAEKVSENSYIPRSEKYDLRARRVPFFTKLLFLFVLLAVIPLFVSSLLMFFSFKEIIDIYIYKPLLWNLKVSREAFLAALSHVQDQALFLIILSGVLVFIAAVLASRSIARPLRTISLGMEKVSKGDYSFKIRQESNDEIGDVVRYFNDMSEEIKRSRELIEAWNRELEIKVAERTEDLRALYDISKAAGSSLDIELLFGRILDQLLPLFKADNCLVLIPDEKGKFYPRFVRGIELPKEAVDPEDRTLAQKLGAKKLITAQLKTKGKIMGFLLLGMKEARETSGEREGSLLSTISDQLAIAIENVGVYEKEKEAVARLTQLDDLKNQFISLVSHELRTPIGVADGYVSLLSAGALGTVTEEQKKYLALVKQNNHRLILIINQLLNFSEMESGKFKIEKKLISMHEVIREALDRMKEAIEKRGAKVDQRLEAKSEKIMGDKDKMADVVVNIVDNALRFTKEGEAPAIEITTRENGNFLRVEIRDQGIGLGKEHLEKIFNKFYQVENYLTRKVGGVGLGLSIVREIIAAHQGKVWAESEGEGRGMKLIFEMPMAEKV